jgi:5'-deoxynucleotidase YfbR-like HD superfamily hydrolase
VGIKSATKENPYEFMQMKLKQIFKNVNRLKFIIRKGTPYRTVITGTTELGKSLFQAGT